MKVTFNSWRQRVSLFLLFACIVATLLAPLDSNIVFPNISDMFNHIASIIQAKMALAEGQFPLRVMPLEHDGWRYPYYQFYSPTSYMLAGFIYAWLTPANPYIAYKITLWIVLVLGGIYMYRLAYWLMKNQIAAVLASVAYLLSPYSFIIINHLTAFNEALALGVLPVVLYYTLQHFYHATLKSFLQVSLVWYLLATIHFITFFYSALFVALWLFLIAIKNIAWKNLLNAGIAFVFGCLLALWHLAPIALFGKYLEMGRTFASSDYFISASPKFSTLLSPAVNIVNKWDEPFNRIQAIHPTISIPIIIAAVICIYAVLNKVLSENKRADSLLLPTVILFIATFVSVWSPINFWQWLPHSLLAIQYSWRILGQVMWVGALLFAWALCWLFKNKLDAKHLVLGVLLLMIATSAWAPINELLYVNFASFLKKPMLVFNAHGYFIDAKKHNKFIDLVDGEMVNALIEPVQAGDDRPGNFLILEKSINISPAYLHSAYSPSLILRGEIPKDYEKNLQLVAVINGKVAAIQNLKPGSFNWNIPLTQFAKTKNKIPVLFILQGSNANPEIKVPINAVLLGGNVNPKKIISVKQTQQHCMQNGETTLCAVKVPGTAKLLELPIIYYPGCLNIKLNGKPVGYVSVFHQGRLIAGIIPELGKINSIEMQFNGILWANYLSSAMWQLWLILLVYAGLRHIFYRKTF